MHHITFDNHPGVRQEDNDASDNGTLHSTQHRFETISVEFVILLSHCVITAVAGQNQQSAVGHCCPRVINPSYFVCGCLSSMHQQITSVYSVYMIQVWTVWLPEWW